MNAETLSKVKRLVKIHGTALAVMTGINRSQLSLYESGAAQLNPAQLEAVRRVLVAEVYKQMAGLREAAEILTKEIPQKETAVGAGAPDGSLESELRCDERNHAE
jgi:transcriptional regulator with XRE-family HTH domain